MDIRSKLRLFIADKQITFNQEFQIMAEIAKAVWGGGGKPKEDEGVVIKPKTAQEALLGFQSLFGGGAMKSGPPPG